MPEDDDEDGEDNDGEYSEHNSSRYYDHDEDDEQEEDDTQTRIMKLVESGANVRIFGGVFCLQGKTQVFFFDLVRRISPRWIRMSSGR